MHILWRRPVKVCRWIPQQQHEQQGADDGEAENHEAVNKGEHVSLILYCAREKSGCARRRLGLADRAACDGFRIILLVAGRSGASRR